MKLEGGYDDTVENNYPPATSAQPFNVAVRSRPLEWDGDWDKKPDGQDDLNGSTAVTLHGTGSF